MLTKVTFTGADDDTDINELLRLSEEFPFAEFGILISKAREGFARYPSRAWINKLLKTSEGTALQLSTHICGRWSRDIFAGRIKWHLLPNIVKVSQRIQLNAAAPDRIFSPALVRSMLALEGSKREFIFQWDGEDPIQLMLAKKVIDCGLNSSTLFDPSGGAGFHPESRPQLSMFVGNYFGFAGGIGPHNIRETIITTGNIRKHPYWIDMEGNVRTQEKFDLDKVRTVLKESKEFIIND